MERLVNLLIFAGPKILWHNFRLSTWENREKNRHHSANVTKVQRSENSAKLKARKTSLSWTSFIFFSTFPLFISPSWAEGGLRVQEKQEKFPLLSPPASLSVCVTCVYVYFGILSNYCFRLFLKFHWSCVEVCSTCEGNKIYTNHSGGAIANARTVTNFPLKQQPEGEQAKKGVVKGKPSSTTTSVGGARQKRKIKQ